MCSEVMTEGAWSRSFNAPNWRARFAEPTVEGVDFPTVGIVEARNDLNEGTLRVSTASPTGASGDATSFNIVTLEGCDLGSVTATCDGEAFTGFTVTDDMIRVRCR